MKILGLKIGERKLVFEANNASNTSMRIIAEGQVGWNVRLHVEFSRLDALQHVSWFAEDVIEATDTSAHARIVRRLVEGYVALAGSK